MSVILLRLITCIFVNTFSCCKENSLTRHSKCFTLLKRITKVKSCEISINNSKSNYKNILRINSRTIKETKDSGTKHYNLKDILKMHVKMSITNFTH